jgi:transposase InsO family protein
LLRISGFTLANERVPRGKAKASLLRSIDLARQFLPLRAVLRVLRLSPARYHSWTSSQKACRLDDRFSCPRTSPLQLTSNEVETIREIVRSEQYRHVPTGTLVILAQRLGKVFVSPSTWYRLIHRFGWRRPRLRVHPAKPKVGLRTTQPNQAWHIDTTVIRLLDGSKAFLHAVIDNFSRRILSWRLADKFDPASTIAVLLEAGRGIACSDEPPTVVADAGVENVNGNVDELIQSGVLRRVIALTELRFSNSMIEAWWRTLKHQWLYLNSLDSASTLLRLVAFYVDEHNTRLPHSAFRGQTSDEMYYGRGDHVPRELDQGRNAARKARLDLNRRTHCAVCPQGRRESSLGHYEAGWLPPVSMTS